MAIQIEKLATPVISANAVAGGTLTADTTYYVLCLFCRASSWREGHAMSEITNEVSVLTTSVNRTIEVTYTYDIDILEFSDAGSGDVRVKTDGNHCLLDGNSITISGTTNYNGVHTVEYDVTDIDGTDTPDSFRISHSWDGDDATGNVNCSADVIGSNHYISIRCSIFEGYIGGEPDQTRLSGNNWIGPGYSVPNAVQNYAIAAAPTGSGGYAGISLPIWRKDSFPKSIVSYDRPYIQITTFEVFDDWVAAMETWLPGNVNYIDNHGGQVESLYFLGHMRFQNLTTLITVEDINFTMDGNMDPGNQTTTTLYLLWKLVNYRQIGCRRPTLAGTFENCVLRDECSDSPYYDRGKQQASTIFPSTSLVFYGSEQRRMDAAGGNIYFVVYNNYFWYVYPQGETPQTRVSNLNIFIGYLYVYAPNYHCSIDADTHYLENINIYSEYDSGTPRDLYLYDPTFDATSEFLNVRAPLQTDGIVRCLRSHLANATVKFFFSIDIRVVDSDGIAIIGATVTMTDKDLTAVADDTDANGDVSMHALSYLNEPGLDAFGDYTFYSPFILTIVKAGYPTYEEEITGFYDKIEKTIALQDATIVNETIIHGSEFYDSEIH